MRTARATHGLALALWAAGALAGEPSPQDIVDRSFKAYNKHDAEAIAALFQADAEIWKPGAEKPEVSGRDGIRQFFLDQFREHPKIRSTIVQRIELQAWVAVHEKTTPEAGEPSRDALLVFDVPEGTIRRVWTMKAGDDDELASEGPVGLQIERWNERDLPRLLATFDERATISRLSTGERLAAGEDALRDRFEKAFEADPGERIEVRQRMALGPWVIYRQRAVPAPRDGSGETIVIYEVRDNVIRRVWLAP